MHDSTYTATRSRPRRIAALAATGAVAALATLAFAGPAVADTNPVSDGDFATPVATANSYDTYCAAGVSGCTTSGSQFGPWTVTSGSVDLYSAGFFPVPTGGVQSVDLDGSQPGGISQDVTLGSNDYQLSVIVGNDIGFCDPNATKTLTWALGSNSGTVTYDPATAAGQWVVVNTSPQSYAAGTYPLSFTSDDPAGDVCGPVITDVTVTAVGSGGAPLANPEIAAGGLTAVGALALITVAVRRRRSAAGT
jgi:hypothetical protein